LPKHFARIVGAVTLAARARCFGKLSMTFFWGHASGKIK
jgi:hypothetical protein